LSHSNEHGYAWSCEHVERDAVLAELPDVGQRLARVVFRRRADEEPQPPLWRQRPAAAVKVVAAHRVHRRGAREHEHLHPLGVRDRLHRIAPRLRLPALARRAVDERRLLLRREAYAVADVHLEVPGGVEEHRVPVRRNVQRHRRVRPPGHLAPVIHVQQKRRARPPDARKVDAQPVHVLPQREREPPRRLPVPLPCLDLLGVDRERRRRHLLQRLDLRRDADRAQEGQLVGLADHRAPDARRRFLPLWLRRRRLRRYGRYRNERQ
jgi:hypothetical protein